MKYILDILYVFVGLAYSPVVIYRAIRHNRYRTGWGQRFGKIGRRSPAKKCIWLHAVSMGEVNAAKTLINELETRFGDFELVISTTTDTGYARATALFSESHEVFYFPFDFSWVIRRAFKRIQPAICLLMELEVWPNFVDTAQRLNVPVVVVNGRISDRSFPKYKRVKSLVKPMFRKVTLVLAQTEEYARRFKEIGAVPENVVVTSSLKYDTAQIADKVEGADTLAAQLQIGDERIWVAGGTGPGEEKIIVEVFNSLVQQDRFKDLRLVVVPRKPERFDEVAELIKQTGFELIRYSQLKNQPEARVAGILPAIRGRDAIDTLSIESVILGDTMGDLRKFYSLATVIFVGRSLIPMGGSDMIEAAALGKCTLFGPHTFNFTQTAEALLNDDGALLVKDQKELLNTMQKCLLEPDFASEIARNGRDIIRKNQGATAKSIEQIGTLLRTSYRGI